MLKGFKTMPKIMAVEAKLRLYDDILFGNPINKISGDLRSSFGVVTRGDMAILKQVTTLAPYAPPVMGPVAIARKGKPALELLMDVMEPKYEFAIKEEFRHIDAVINAGGKYKFDPAAFQTMIHNA